MKYFEDYPLEELRKIGAKEATPKNNEAMETEEFMQQLDNFPYTIERQLLQEPDYRQISATEAGKIPHSTVQQYLSDCDKIYNWLMQKKKK